MSSLLIGLIGALMATNQPAAVNNPVAQTNRLSVHASDANDPVEKEFQKLEEDDDAAHDEVDGWIRQNQEFAARGAGIPNAELNQRIRKRLEPVQKAYDDFIKEHPDHARVRIAYASFLDGIGDEEGEITQLEKARGLDPKNPAVWNQLANYFGHSGPLTNAFIYYAKAIELNPSEPVYYQNFATTVYLYRKDAREYFHIDEQQVFDKALDLYAQALRHDPTNFLIAVDLAESHYAIRPVRTEDALIAWTNALHIAGDEIEREGVYIHLARFKYNAGRFAEARAHLNAVTNNIYDELKQRLLRNLIEREKETNALATASATNQPPDNPAIKK